jgi:DNA-binding NarL/FixJ family response regulator
MPETPGCHPSKVWLAVFPGIYRFATIGATMAYRILIVDDHPSFRATVRTLLVADGFEVVGEAADGRSALEAVKRLHPDLVLLDVQLPDMDGFAVANELLRQNGTGPKVVLTSSHDESDFGPIVGRCGAAAFVPKGELSGAALRAVLR